MQSPSDQLEKKLDGFPWRVGNKILIMGKKQRWELLLQDLAKFSRGLQEERNY
jgi:hypothetical protein